MFTNRFFRTCGSILLISIILSALDGFPAYAQGDADPQESSCATCHENRYLLHDTDIASIDEAVQAYLDGRIVDRVDRLH